ncbi:Cytochrome P450 family protein [Ceratobasidium theobromae]|uniref:Cytochrome P450 family protein n=1 Tax=Ceratobasidium theobromae TaxID=1582974 RepID=A0A5N5QLR3_9AGAM|nr:Cytochrome P450 family protein [Ceratobasidium theobromae]
MDYTTSIKNRLLSSNVSPWLVSGMCVALTLFTLARRRKLLVQLPGPPSKSFNTGHFKEIGGAGGSDFQEHVFSTYGPTVKLNEFLFTLDPTATHSVLVKDKTNFGNTIGATLMMRSIFGGGLLGLRGEEHRVHRKVYTLYIYPRLVSSRSFTVAQSSVHDEMPIFMGIANQTCKGVKNELDKAGTSSKELDVFPWASAAALELIGEAGLGYSFNSFSGERNEYNEAAKSVTQISSRLSPVIGILPYIYRIGTSSFRRWVMQHIPSRIVQQLLRAVDIQNQMAREVLQARQALLSSGVDLSSEAGRGRDIMTLLMKANEAEGSEFHIDHQGMIGHMNVFIFAGHETTSTAVTRMLEVLANHPQIQVQLREELRRYFEEHTNDTHHDGLLELPFLDAVVRETLRFYPPVALISRACQEDTILPLEYPVDTPTGKITSIPVKKGTRIFMSAAMMNRDDRIWGERSHEFWPERWIGHKVEDVTRPGASLPGVYSSM